MSFIARGPFKIQVPELSRAGDSGHNDTAHLFGAHQVHRAPVRHPGAAPGAPCTRWAERRCALS
ncbi:hypothetical protein MFTT_05520 [Mycolicibacterium fortuitum subsp. fortuitum]|nr:hypothetical protein MFTT_05520 [Mycolicibacterium fortuitum subsp. fortuitum]